MSITAAINLTTFDVQRLEPLLARSNPVHSLPEHLSVLLAKLHNCIEIPPAGMPPHVVTMNSEVRLRDMESDKEMTCLLVFPLQADVSEGRISVLAPLGAMLLGSRVGNVLKVQTPHNVRSYRIEEILFQPEAAGRFDL